MSQAVQIARWIVELISAQNLIPGNTSRVIRGQHCEGGSCARQAMAFYYRPVDSKALRRSVLGGRRWHLGSVASADGI